MKQKLLSLIAGCMALSSVATAANVGDTYTKVASIDDLTLNAEYILCYNTAGMGAISGKYFKYIVDGVKLNNDVATIANADVQTFQVVTGNKADTYAFQFKTDSYMSCTGIANNSMTTSATLVDNCNLNITISNGVATIIPTNNSNDNKNKFQCNTSSGQERFANYKTGTQKNCTLYKKQEADPTAKPGDVQFTPEAGAVYEGTEITMISYGATKICYSVDGNAYIEEQGSETKYTINGACTIKAYGENANGKGTEITAVYTIAPKPDYSIEFLSGPLSSDAYTTSSTIVTDPSKKYFGTITSISNSYLGVNGIKLGKSDAAGDVSFTLSDNAEMPVDKIIVNCSKYGNDTGNLVITLTLDDKSTISKTVENGNLGDKQEWGFDFPITITSIKLESSAKRLYVKSLNFYNAKIAPSAPELHESVKSNLNGDTYTGSIVKFADPEENVTIMYKLTEKTTTPASAPAKVVVSDEEEKDYTAYTPGTEIKLYDTHESISFYSKHTNGLRSEVTSYTVKSDVKSGIAGIAAESGEAVYYNLQGVRVDNPVKGLYIRVANGKSSKVIL